jgi:thiol:disulfide interchange protein
MLTFLVFLGVLLLAYAIWLLEKCVAYLHALTVAASQRPVQSGTAGDQSPWVPADQP